MMGYRIVDTIEGAALEAIYRFCNQHPKEVAGQPLRVIDWMVHQKKRFKE
jgi:hypothetical protein